MPIYVFNCECGKEKEELVPIGTDTFVCSSCGGVMKKIISKSSFILKGSCWASDSYGTKTKKQTKTN